MSIVPSTESEQFAQAFEAARARIDAVLLEQAPQINVDVMAAVAQALQVTRIVRSLAPSVEHPPHGFEPAAFDDLELLARALAQAQTEYLAAQEPTAEVAALGSELVGVRDALRSDVVSLAKHGVVDGGVLDKLQNGTGYVGIAQDVMALVQLFRRNEAAVAGKTPVERAALADAKTKAERLLLLVGEHGLPDPRQKDASDTRQRAFALFVKAYDELRRQVLYIRYYEGDADRYCPSLYGGRRRGSDAAADTTTPTAPPPAAHAPAAPATPATATPAPSPSVLRGGNPFLEGS